MGNGIYYLINDYIVKIKLQFNHSILKSLLINVNSIKVVARSNLRNCVFQIEENLRIEKLK